MPVNPYVFRLHVGASFVDSGVTYKLSGFDGIVHKVHSKWYSRWKNISKYYADTIQLVNGEATVDLINDPPIPLTGTSVYCGVIKAAVNNTDDVLLAPHIGAEAMSYSEIPWRRVLSPGDVSFWYIPYEEARIYSVGATPHGPRISNNFRYLPFTSADLDAEVDVAFFAGP